jgi:RNA polymerase sigma-70 factor (ECF subfamily)
MTNSLTPDAYRKRVAMVCLRDASPPSDSVPAGSVDRLERLCRDNWLPVYRCVSRWANSRAEAEDLTQEAFVRALAKGDRVGEDDASFRAYLITTARNVAIDRWRAAERSGSRSGLDLSGRADPGRGPEAEAVGRDERERLLAAIDRLPDHYSDVLRMRIVQGFTSQEAGRHLGMTANAVRQLQYRALAALRREVAIPIGEER